MSYKSIFNTKPKKEDKRAFCKRISDFLNRIDFYDENDIIKKDGLKLINRIFIYSKFNNGYNGISDLIKSNNPSYESIFSLAGKKDDFIQEEEILMNIEIIINCLTYNPIDHSHLYYYPTEATKTIKVIFDAIKEYLLACGYKVYNDEKEKILKIIPNELSIDVNELDNKLRIDVLNYYDFKNQNNRTEKKRILRDIIDKLEPKRDEIRQKLSKHIEKVYGSFSNNFDIRHNNITQGDSSYNPTIAALSDDEIIKWYDYIYSFMLNIYINLDSIKDVNIDNQFK